MAELDQFFSPKSIAVIGASRKPGKVGHATLKRLKENKEGGIFKGEVYPVNPHADEILGLKAYGSVAEIPEVPDLAVICIPAKYVPAVVEELGTKGTKSVVIISGGFAEVGGEGVRLQDELIKKAREHGVRIVGPNCIGVVSTKTGVDTMFLPARKEINGSALPSLPRPGHGSISLTTQSGAFGVACIDYMAGEGLGLAKFVSYGNKADVDEVELVEYLAEDQDTKVILVYVESIERGREFMKASRKAARRKPIVVLKAGRTEAGARAAMSHTAALAGMDQVYQAAFRQCGILRAGNIEELFDVAKALSMQPPAKGKGVAVLTDGGGAGVMTVDELESRKQSMADLSGEAKKFNDLMKRGVIPSISTIGNPVDLTGSVDDESYVGALKVLLDSKKVHGVIVLALHYPPALTGGLPEKLSEASRGSNKPIVFCDVGWGDYAIAFREKFETQGFPAYPTPERAAAAMSALVEYGEIRRRLEGAP